jgi:chitinase
VVGYYIAWGIYGRNFFVSDMDVNKLTHINYAFANLDADGNVLIGDQWADADYRYPGEEWPGTGNFGALNRLKQEHPHLKTIISIGGWTWSTNFPVVAANPTKRATFVSTAIDFMLTYGFDGIDIDWEFPVEGGPDPGTAEDPENFTKLLLELRAGLDSLDRHYELTLATTQNPNRVQYLEIPKIAPVLDFINVMTYDFAGPWVKSIPTGHNAPLYQNPNNPTATASLFTVNAAVASYLDAGLPRDKLVLGVPFYGYIYGAVPPGENRGLYSSWNDKPEGSWAPGIVDYDDIRDNYLSSGDWEYHYDPSSKVPWLYSETLQQFISFDDVGSLAEKTNYVKEQNLKGVMIWDLSSDRNYDLLTALTAELQQCSSGTWREGEYSVPQLEAPSNKKSLRG